MAEEHFEHFDLGAVISSLLKTPEKKGGGRGRGGVFRSDDITARVRSAAKCSSAIHYSYQFLIL